MDINVLVRSQNVLLSAYTIKITYLSFKCVYKIDEHLFYFKYADDVSTYCGNVILIAIFQIIARSLTLKTDATKLGQKDTYCCFVRHHVHYCPKIFTTLFLRLI